MTMICRKVSDSRAIEEGLAGYMRDESGLSHAMADCVYFPSSTEETAVAVMEAVKDGRKIVVSGGRTGIVGGAVVAGPCSLISLERFKPKPVVRFDSERNQWFVKVGAGMTVAELASALKSGQFDSEMAVPQNELFYPVDPTETSAQLGGTAATNASGARTLFYGPTRDWVEWIRVVIADGRVIELRRGDVTARGLDLSMEDASGGIHTVTVPDLKMPGTKATVGYFAEPGMDAVDLFVGSEGTLGIITEMELRLLERPKESLYLCQYFNDENRALEFVLALIADSRLSPLAAEYFDENSMELLRRKREEEGASSAVPDLPTDVRAVIYTEFILDENGGFEKTAEHLSELLRGLDLSPEKSWAGFQRKDLQGMKDFRHALPETVNSIIARRKASDPEIHKVGTDMAVPLEGLKEMMSVYRLNLKSSGLEYVIFGHIGNGHLHVNILPRSREEVEEAKRLYANFAREAVSLGGSVSAEHGIGRIKHEFLRIQYSDDVIDQMKKVKLALDPNETFNPGVIFGVKS